MILKKGCFFKGEAWFLSNHFVWLPTQGLLKQETTTWIYDYLNVIAIKALMISWYLAFLRKSYCEFLALYFFF